MFKTFDSKRLKPIFTIFRMVIGITEIVCAVVMLLLTPRSLVRPAYYVLAVIMVGGAYTHYRAGDPLPSMGGSLFLLSLLTFLIVRSEEVKVKVN